MQKSESLLKKTLLENSIMSPHIDSILRTLVVLREMLIDRGMDHSVLEHLSDEEVRMLDSSSQVFQLRISEDTVVIYFMEHPKLKPIRDNMPDETVKRVIYIMSMSPVADTIQKIGKEHPDKDLQFFTLKDLEFNISRHQVVPRHDAIRDKDEIKKILQEHQIKSRAKDMPIILKSDPMARYLDIKPGQLVKITRPSPSAAESISYRCCI